MNDDDLFLFVLSLSLLNLLDYISPSLAQAKQQDCPCPCCCFTSSDPFFFFSCF